MLLRTNRINRLASSHTSYNWIKLLLCASLTSGTTCVYSYYNSRRACHILDQSPRCKTRSESLGIFVPSTLAFAFAAKRSNNSKSSLETICKKKKKERLNHLPACTGDIKILLTTKRKESSSLTAK